MFCVGMWYDHFHGKWGNFPQVYYGVLLVNLWHESGFVIMGLMCSHSLILLALMCKKIGRVWLNPLTIRLHLYNSPTSIIVCCFLLHSMVFRPLKIPRNMTTLLIVYRCEFHMCKACRACVCVCMRVCSCMCFEPQSGWLSFLVKAQHRCYLGFPSKSRWGFRKKVS